VVEQGAAIKIVSTAIEKGDRTFVVLWNFIRVHIHIPAVIRRQGTETIGRQNQRRGSKSKVNCSCSLFWERGRASS